MVWLESEMDLAGNHLMLVSTMSHNSRILRQTPGALPDGTTLGGVNDASTASKKFGSTDQMLAIETRSIQTRCLRGSQENQRRNTIKVTQ